LPKYLTKQPINTSANHHITSMVLSFYGGAQTVTGSKYLITLNNGKRILLDCGLFQGGGAAQEKLNREFGFDPQQVNYLVLSHAHIDHSGLIPRLVKLGFTGPIYCTPPTLELCELVLADSCRIQQNSKTVSRQVAGKRPVRQRKTSHCIPKKTPGPASRSS